MFLADFRRQGAFDKLAKWLLGVLVVSLQARRRQLGCHLGFKMGFGGPSRAEDGQRWPQERTKKVTALNGKIQDGGVSPSQRIKDPRSEGLRIRSSKYSKYLRSEVPGI